MDTLTHALSGALVGRVLAGRRAPAGGANGSAATSGAASGASSAARPTVPVWQMVVAGTVAATFPDLDFVLGWISELTYLRGHRGVTHSLILLPLWGLLIAGAQMVTVHVYAVRRGYPTYPRGTFRQLLRSIWVSIPALMTPVIIVGGIRHVDKVEWKSGKAPPKKRKLPVITEQG